MSAERRSLRDAPGGRRRRSGLAAALFVVGGLFLLLAGGTLAYAEWGEWQHRVRQPPGPRETLPASLPPPVGGNSAGNAVQPAKPVREPPVRLTIPRINVDSSIMEVTVKNGEYEVPSFDVGFHADSAALGDPGNSVFTGHLETINAGRVFARLHQLAVGDAVYVYTKTHRYDWVVQEVRTVPNTDRSFIQPTSDIRITLYTCAGTYDPRADDYSHRRVVVGKLVQSTPRA